MTSIDWVNQLLIHKKSWESFSESDKKDFSPYMINRWLSMDIDFIEIVNFFQKYSIGLLKSKDVYKWYCDILPKGKRYNKYITNNKKVKYDPFLIEMMCNHFECSKVQVTEYFELIDKQELKQILEMYGIDKKQIKKVLKWK